MHTLTVHALYYYQWYTHLKYSTSIRTVVLTFAYCTTVALVLATVHHKLVKKRWKAVKRRVLEQSCFSSRMWLHIRPDNTSTDCFTLLHKIPLPSLSFCCWTPHYYCHHHHNFIVVVFMWVCAFVDCCLWCSLIWSCCSSVISCCNPDVRTITVTVYLLYSVILLDYYYWSTTSTSWLTTTTEVLLGVCYCWCCIAFYFILFLAHYSSLVSTSPFRLLWTATLSQLCGTKS